MGVSMDFLMNLIQLGLDAGILALCCEVVFRQKAEIKAKERKNRMKHSTYTSYDELPLMLSVAEVAAVLGISRAGAYELVHGNEFPALKIGSRIVVPKDKFLAWIDANSGSKNAPL